MADHRGGDSPYDPKMKEESTTAMGESLGQKEQHALACLRNKEDKVAGGLGSEGEG